jgi:NH3-dependent NAD+ synthetase
MYCHHHKDQMTAQDQKELEQRERKNTVIGIVGGIVIAVLCLLAAAGG